MTSKDPGSAATNGQVEEIPNSSPENSEEGGRQSLGSSHSLNEEGEDMREENMDGEQPVQEGDDTPMDQIQHDLDELTFSGATINNLEVQLIRTKELYHRTHHEGRLRVDQLARKLHTHINKSEIFVKIWRKAKEVQERSNRAAAKFDKASSQHAAAKEMIRVAELQLEERLKEAAAQEGPASSPSPLDAAWQEMLNHATGKVARTEKERRDSELEHRQVLQECNEIMTEYRATERRLHTHIAKSRPYYEARFKTNKKLLELKATIKDLEQKISETKLKYSASLKKLDLLSTEIHMRRGTQLRHSLDPRQVMSTGNSPVLRHNGQRSPREDSVSMDSLQMSELEGDFTGSVGELHGGYSNSVSELQGDLSGSVGSLNAEHCHKKTPSDPSSMSSISPPESPTATVPPASLPSPQPEIVTPLPPLTITPEPSTSVSPSLPLTIPSSLALDARSPSSVSTSAMTSPSLLVTLPSSFVTTPQSTPRPSANFPNNSSSSTPIPSSSPSSPAVMATSELVAQCDAQVEVHGDSSNDSHESLARQMVELCVDRALSDGSSSDQSSSSAEH